MDCCGHFFFSPDIMNEHQTVMEARKKLKNCPYSHLKGWENIQSPDEDNSSRELVLKHLNATREVHLDCFVYHRRTV